jgi:hypothetical protein
MACMQRNTSTPMNFPINFVLKRLSIASIVLAFCSPANATGSSLAELQETLMEANANESLFIGFVFGVDNSTILDYKFDINIADKSFKYSLTPGQTYQGLGIELAASGAYDPSSGAYKWSSDGDIGGQSWTSVGFVEWIGDPQGTVSTTITLGGVNYKVTGDVTWDSGPIIQTSQGSYTFKAPSGQTYGPYKGSDLWDIMNGEWHHTVTVPKNPVTPTGVVTFFEGLTTAQGGSSTYKGTIKDVPAPLPIFGVAAAFGYSRKLRKRISARNVLPVVSAVD